MTLDEIKDKVAQDEWGKLGWFELTEKQQAQEVNNVAQLYALEEVNRISKTFYNAVNQ